MPRFSYIFFVVKQHHRDAAEAAAAAESVPCNIRSTDVITAS